MILVDTPVLPWLYVKQEGQKMKNIVSALALVIALTACASTGSVYNTQTLTPPASSKTQLVIYSPTGMFAQPSGPWVEVNGVEKCMLPRGSFMIVDADAGTTTASISMWGSPGVSRLSIKTKPGSRHYIQVQANMGRVLGLGGVIAESVENATSDDKGEYLIREVDKGSAQKELTGTKQSTTCK
jgi:hypothetical protein